MNLTREMHSALDVLRDSIARIDDFEQQHKEDVSVLQENIRSLEEHISELQTQIEESRKMAEDVQSKNAFLVGSIEHKNEEINELLIHIESLKQDVIKKTEEKEQAIKELNELKSQLATIDELQSSVHQLRGVIKKKDEQILSLQEILELGSKGGVSSQREENLNVVSDHEATIEQLNQTIENLSKEIEALRNGEGHDNHSLSAENLKLRIEIEKNNALIDDLKKRLERAQLEPTLEADTNGKKIFGVFPLRKRSADHGNIRPRPDTQHEERSMDDVLSAYIER